MGQQELVEAGWPEAQHIGFVFNEQEYSERGLYAGIADRAHHGRYIARIIHSLLDCDPTVASDPHASPKRFEKIRQEAVRWNNRKIAQVNRIEYYFCKFSKLPWFYKLITSLADDAYSQYLKKNQITVSNPIYVRVVEKYLKTLLLELTNTIWGENSHHISRRKYEDVQIESHKLNAFIADFSDQLRSLSEEESRELIAFLKYVCTDHTYNDILDKLCLFPEEFLQVLSDIRDAHEENLDDYREIDSTDFKSEEYAKAYELEVNFAKKVRDLYLNNPESLVVLNINPGELCRYNKVEGIGCAPHCLDPVTIEGSHGDQNCLALIELFIESYPAYKDLFVIKKYYNPKTKKTEVCEVAFPIKMFGVRIFRDNIISFVENEEPHHSLRPEFTGKHNHKNRFKLES